MESIPAPPPPPLPRLPLDFKENDTVLYTRLHEGRRLTSLWMLDIVEGSRVRPLAQSGILPPNINFERRWEDPRNDLYSKPFRGKLLKPLGAAPGELPSRSVLSAAGGEAFWGPVNLAFEGSSGRLASPKAGLSFVRPGLYLLW